MGMWVDDIWNWKLTWRRDLFERELDLQEDLMRFLQNVNMLEGKEDEWKWGKNGSFTVKEAYGGILDSNFTNSPNVFIGNAAGSIRKVAAPLKVQVTAWRLLWNRLSTADNIKRTTALTDEERICQNCKTVEESASHFFLRCSKAEWVWNRMADWIGINWSSPRSIESHFISFKGLLGGGLKKKKLGGLWSCVIWVLWNWRNGKIFDKKEWDSKKIEDEIKCRF